ncbi:MAG: PTS glucose transporter subunit IIA [Spirochaetaceae bacterium]|jgi:glucose-specific phosphotransferase system IIA component|nr:PTS glucose transporter subunit IIA [Spirochaetaceae bacterium]
MAKGFGKILEGLLGGKGGGNADKAFKVYAPMGGSVAPITSSADPAHQAEAVGKGVCIMPQGGKIFAPFDADVDMVFDTKHAIGLSAKAPYLSAAVELLIHCGIDTVKLNGDGFTAHVKDGDKVKKGDLLLEYDEGIITAAGYSLETQVVVTNSGDFKKVTQAATGIVNAGDLVLCVE